MTLWRFGLGGPGDTCEGRLGSQLSVTLVSSCLRVRCHVPCGQKPDLHDLFGLLSPNIRRVQHSLLIHMPFGLLGVSHLSSEIPKRGRSKCRNRPKSAKRTQKSAQEPTQVRKRGLLRKTCTQSGLNNQVWEVPILFFVNGSVHKFLGGIRVVVGAVLVTPQTVWTVNQTNMSTIRSFIAFSFRCHHRFQRSL